MYFVKVGPPSAVLILLYLSTDGRLTICPWTIWMGLKIVFVDLLYIFSLSVPQAEGRRHCDVKGVDQNCVPPEQAVTQVSRTHAPEVSSRLVGLAEIYPVDGLNECGGQRHIRVECLDPLPSAIGFVFSVRASQDSF